jgi:predicted lipoprotein with Yx(FWY)xxD motif
MRTRDKIISALLLLLAVAALGLVACGDDDDGEDAAPVSVATIDGSEVLVDSRRRALYTADQETDRRVLCTDGCTAIWDPVIVGSGEHPESGDLDLGLVKRPDGSEQVTFRGHPLYRFTEEGPGELSGDGFADEFAGVAFTWSAATVRGSADSKAAPDGGLGESGLGY